MSSDRGGSGSAAFGLAAVAAGILVLQLPQPFGFHAPIVDARASALVTHPAAVAVAFVMVVVGSLILGAAGSAGLKIPVVATHLPSVALAVRPVGLVLLAAAAGTLAVLCSLVWLDVATGWYLPLLAATLGLATVGLAVSEPPFPRHARSRSALKWSDVFLIVLVAVTVGWSATRHLGHWYFSWIGDEIAFFDHAADLIHGSPQSIFDLGFVYSKHPVADSLYQSLFLRMFGENVFGWRLAEVAVVVVAAVLAYLVSARATSGLNGRHAVVLRLPAVIAGLAVGCSAYTLAFCHIGYNNLHTLVPALLIVLGLACLGSRPSATRLFVFGCVLGSCLYTFLATPVMWFVLAVGLAPRLLEKTSGSRKIAAAAAAGGFLCTTLPIAAAKQASLIATLRAGETLGFGAERGLIAGWASSMGVFWHNDRFFNHHVAASLLDPLTGGLAAIGAAAAVLLFLRSPFDRLLLLWFVLGALVVAWSHPYAWPSLTRLLFVLPAAALLAARGATVLIEIFEDRFHLSPTATGAILASIAVLIPAANVHQAYSVVPRRLPPAPLTSTLRALQEYPASPVIEVGYQRDRNHDVVLRPYPESAARTGWTTGRELRLLGDRVDPSSIFLVYSSRRLAETVAEILAPRWNGSCYLESDGRCGVWIFEPGSAASPGAAPGSLTPQP